MRSRFRGSAIRGSRAGAVAGATRGSHDHGRTYVRAGPLCFPHGPSSRRSRHAGFALSGQRLVEPRTAELRFTPGTKYVHITMNDGGGS